LHMCGRMLTFLEKFDLHISGPKTPGDTIDLYRSIYNGIITDFAKITDEFQRIVRKKSPSLSLRSPGSYLKQNFSKSSLIIDHVQEFDGWSRSEYFTLYPTV